VIFVEIRKPLLISCEVIERMGSHVSAKSVIVDSSRAKSKQPASSW
jgi:hypothetical protein